MTNKKSATPDLPENHLIVFQEKTIRRTWHNNEWWFAIVDVVAVLTESVQPEGYVKDLRRRDKELAKGWGQIATPLRVETEGGVQRVNCANTEGLFRIIQSIPSPRAEPFKRWLAQVGYERVQDDKQPMTDSADTVRPEPVEGPWVVRQAHHEWNLAQHEWNLAQHEWEKRHSALRQAQGERRESI